MSEVKRKTLAAPPLPSASPSGGTVQRILVVEDHDDTRAMLKMILELESFAVLEALDGKEAYDCAIKECPDLILMDLNPPHVDGVTVTARSGNMK